MLASRYRLTGSKNIDRVKSKGKLYQRKLFGVSVFDREDKEPSRFAFVVSTKISKQAVQRNRMKRAMSESIRHTRTRMKDGFDLIFLAKKIMARNLTDEIMREVELAVKQAGLMK